MLPYCRQLQNKNKLLRVISTTFSHTNVNGKKKMFMILFVLLLYNTWGSALGYHEQEYCVGKVFNPKCSEDEMILMESALYGQMSIGKCINMDVGYLGCQSNVLAQFDRECSGKKSCEILVTDVHIEATGGCPSVISKYLLARYKCIKNGLTVLPQCTSNAEMKIMLAQQHSFISSQELGALCVHTSWILTTESGQRLNASVITLSHIVNTGSYGSIMDPLTSNRVVIGDGPRINHLISSTGNELKLTFPGSQSSNSKYILEIKVFGCTNLSPPNGAWMTRNGDEIEMGCHSGEKTWKMHCENNQWVGAVGQCGVQAGISNSNVERYDEAEVFSDDLSLNSILFAVCSVIIFISSLIFMIGVCLFKSQRKYADQPCYNNGTLVERMIPPSDSL